VVINKRGRGFFIVVICTFFLLIIFSYFVNAIFNNESGGMVKYSLNEVPNELIITKGEQFNLDIDYDGEYTFSDDSDLFDIDPINGEIVFIPDNVGDHFVVIIALKDIEHFDYKLINFRVVE